jgi:hypothetical protein
MADRNPNEGSSPGTPARKPQKMSWETFVERRIREAEEAGQFDNLPGSGRPIPGIDEPPDENWWIRQKLRDEGLSVIPPILEARLARQRTLDELPRMTSEAAVRVRLEALNKQIRDAIASPAAGPPIVVLPVDIEATITEWRTQKRNHGSDG